MSLAQLLVIAFSWLSLAFADANVAALFNVDVIHEKPDYVWPKANVAWLNIVADGAASTGAVCLDGTPPGYYFREGHGDGVDKWIFNFESECLLEAERR